MTKISISGQDIDFSPKFIFLPQISIFAQNFWFLTKKFNFPFFSKELFSRKLTLFFLFSQKFKSTKSTKKTAKTKLKISQQKNYEKNLQKTFYTTVLGSNLGTNKIDFIHASTKRKKPVACGLTGETKNIFIQ